MKSDLCTISLNVNTALEPLRFYPNQQKLMSFSSLFLVIMFYTMKMFLLIGIWHFLLAGNSLGLELCTIFHFIDNY